jgi:hypothetical protein
MEGLAQALGQLSVLRGDSNGKEPPSGEDEIYPNDSDTRVRSLSMGAALLEELIDADTTFTLLLLLDADRKVRPPTST